MRQGWVAVTKRWIRKRTRNQYADQLGHRLNTKHAFADFVQGCRNIKRERIERERALRRALELMVDHRIARFRRIFLALHQFAQARIAHRRWREEQLRLAVLRWMAHQKRQVFEKYALPCIASGSCRVCA